VISRDDTDILAGLNPAQREAATVVRGPVAILAGAGTGKTATITRRVALQVTSGAFEPAGILAVTFTEKAAGELRGRLRALGVEGVEARTFHSAALSQLSRLWPQHTGSPLGEVLDSKGPLIASLANALPAPHKFLPRRDLASEIEWAKNRMVPVDGYLEELETSGHQPPIPPELMERVYRGYERRKGVVGKFDFEDMLSMAVRLFDERPAAVEQVRARYHAFTVDEFQDVNPLQAALLDRWLGERDEVCVVGDDYQTIYGFTGATPEYLLGFAARFPHARVVRLEDNYRSTPEILATANLLAAALGGFDKTLRATRPSGSDPLVRPVTNEAEEIAFVVDAALFLHQTEGVPYEEIAVLYRINARSEPYEEAFAAAGVAYQVRDGAFLRRPGPRSALRLLRSADGDVIAAVGSALASVGFDPARESSSDAGSPEEATRQADLARLASLAEEFVRAGSEEGVAGFLQELGRRFSTESSGRGVNLLTYHRAKGLEFDAVFLPRLLDGELPFRSGRSRAPVEEERRLLYVGITRARRHLYVTWPADARGGPSPFVAELGWRGPARPAGAASPATAAAKHAAVPSTGVGGDLYEALRRWRKDRASRDGVPAYVVFHDATLAAIAALAPRTSGELLSVSGVGPTKLERYGPDVLAVVSSA
jgi:DNA helicase II / ATP-dependent DNA helicase PcrA